jgi:hypothetical protein
VSLPLEKLAFMTLPTPTINSHSLREAWLEAAVQAVTPLFSAKGYVVPTCKVSVGFASTGTLRGHIGQCWSTRSCQSGINQIFISPVLAEAFDVLDTLVHELVHAVDLDGGHDETKRYKSLSHGPKPLVLNFKGIEQATDKALELSRSWIGQGGEQGAPTVCVIAYSKDVRDSAAKVFSKSGLKTTVIDETHNLNSDHATVYFSTMHRAKGLEFDQVIVIGPSEYLGDPSETDSKRKLLYVAITRAKKEAALILI